MIHVLDWIANSIATFVWETEEMFPPTQEACNQATVDSDKMGLIVEEGDISTFRLAAAKIIERVMETMWADPLKTEPPMIDGTNQSVALMYRVPQAKGGYRYHAGHVSRTGSGHLIWIADSHMKYPKSGDKFEYMPFFPSDWVGWEGATVGKE